MTGSPKLEQLFLLYNCKCSLYLSEEVFFKARREGLREKKKTFQKLFSAEMQNIEPYVYEKQHMKVLLLALQLYQKPLMPWRRDFIRAYMDTKKALFTMEIERQRAGIVEFISSHPGTLLQDDSIIFCSAFTIKRVFQVEICSSTLSTKIIISSKEKPIIGRKPHSSVLGWKRISVHSSKDIFSSNSK